VSTADESAAISSRPSERWTLTPFEPKLAAQLAETADLPLAVAELLVARGITSSEAAAEFLNPNISQLHSPYLMLGMETAVKRVETAIARGEIILLYGDYDVDGTTAVVLLKTAIEMLGGIVRFHVPHRLREGYGLQASVLEEAFAAGVRLVITVDTGMRAFAEAKAAAAMGLDLIITDHHLAAATDELPTALAILNPNQHRCSYPSKDLCGAGIAMKLAQALLERRDEVRTRTKTLPSFLKLLSIATVADAVPLLGENRAIVALGLKELSHPVGLGLCALMEVAQIDPAKRRLTAFDLGFRLGPRINAAGRMDVAGEVVELFTTRDAVRVKELAAKLEAQNQERRQTEKDALEQIEERLATDASLVADRLLVLEGTGWHRGVIGILASRVVDRTAKPALVVAIEDGVAYGSGRSVRNFHLLNALESCRNEFTRFGGHAYAVGFAIPAEQLPKLRQKLQEYAVDHLPENPVRELECHAELPLNNLNPELGKWIARLEPFGHGNPEPQFLARGVRVCRAVRILKERHAKLELAEGPRGVVWQALAWQQAERTREIGIVEGTLLDIVYRLRENEHPQFGGLELEVVSMRPAESETE
jgi:single-stranded-DNA-specific exonuclease